MVNFQGYEGQSCYFYIFLDIYRGYLSTLWNVLSTFLLIEMNIYLDCCLFD